MVPNFCQSYCTYYGFIEKRLFKKLKKPFQSSKFKSAFGSVDLMQTTKKLRTAFPADLKIGKLWVWLVTRKIKSSLVFLHLLYSNFNPFWFRFYMISILVKHYIHLNCSCVENANNFSNFTPFIFFLIQ